MANRRALIVAIDDYPPPNALPSCINDANAMLALLRLLRFETRPVFNNDATLPNVSAGLQWLFNGAVSGDDLVFYYSGHGYTSRVDGVMKQSLVLFDQLFYDSQLCDLSQTVPPATLTVFLDSCFSGGFDKSIILSAKGIDQIEIVKSKAFVPTPAEVARLGMPDPFIPGAKFVTGTKAFAKPSIAPIGNVAKDVRHSASAKGDEALVSVEKSAGSQLNGLLISACKEDETASASTSMTEGKSAFTYGMLQAVKVLGGDKGNRELFESASQLLRNAGFKQTPVLCESTVPGDLSERMFLTLDAISGNAPGPAQASTPGTVDADTLARLLIALLPALLKIGAARKAAEADEKRFDAANLIAQLLSALSRAI